MTATGHFLVSLDTPVGSARMMTSEVGLRVRRIHFEMTSSSLAGSRRPQKIQSTSDLSAATH